MSNYVNLLDIVYPVGSVYMSTSAISPATIIGGTWQIIDEATYLSAAGENESALSTYGENKHILSVDEMPAHSHFCSFASDGRSGSEWVVKYERYGKAGGWDTNENGSTRPHNNRPKSCSVWMYIRTA